jgi:hypothetical protein
MDALLALHVLLRVAVVACAAGPGGGIAGLVAAILILQARYLRNAVLVHRGQLPARDCILQLSFVPLCAVASLIVGAALGGLLAPQVAILIGALAPAGLLALVTIGGTMAQAFD